MGPRQEPSSPLSFLLFSLSSLFCLLALSTTVHAADPSGWTVLPSNNSRDLSWTRSVRFHLQSARIQLPANITLAPLTPALVSLDRRELSDFHLKGELVNVNAANSLQLNSSDIAFISCDKSDYPGNLDASSTVSNVVTSKQRASAVLLYSSELHHCNYSSNEADAAQYPYVFTFLNPDFAKQIKTQLSSPKDNYTSEGNATVGVVPDMSFTMSGTPQTQDTGGGSSDNPNTAMIILYSITGIITALFLAIIITGAVRAHRHPERYGPRYTAGRPRQSRARGIARAMLETIPIVKFGDGHDPKVDAAKGDVEMSLESEDGVRQNPETREATTTAADGTEVAQAQPKDPNSPPEATISEKRTEGDEQPNYSCPICTDDFVKGQDLRVLPCNHQFHPDCIDPWLVNVSGTCPLCRIDLHPTQAEGEHEAGEGDESTEGPAQATNESTADASHQRGHHRLSNYLHGSLNARRMRDASVEERLAALRSVREEANQNAQNADNDEQVRRRSRLTARLKDKFRIRTRAHGEDGGEASRG
ncbi:RING-H2 finger protein [Aspergillus affinis]|uniref:RING-H2 finger protein n=1 Tax=Aspergillus affinis TaxID=1070780 RepID=UPI0022FE754E|nr:uncharacterized protein KD926_011411 [Aspergillus affinis]KAI9037979.1 hypothetical protein KD926_011411 [Aspergillus affinis]